MQHHGAGAQVPERRRPHLGRQRLAVGDAVGECAHVVKQEVRIDPDGLVAKDLLELGGVARLQGGDVALGTADRVEDRLAGHSAARGLRRGREVALEGGDRLHERQAVRVRPVLDLGDGVAVAHVAVRGRLHGDDGVRESHLRAGGIAAEGEHGRDLRLPAEAPDAQRARGVLDQVDAVGAAGDAVAVGVIRVLERDQRCIGNRLDEAEREHARRDALAHMVCGGGKLLEAGRADGLPLADRPAERLQEVELAVLHPREVLHRRSAPAADRRFVACRAVRLVERRTEALLHRDVAAVVLQPFMEQEQLVRRQSRQGRAGLRLRRRGGGGHACGGHGDSEGQKTSSHDGCDASCAVMSGSMEGWCPRPRIHPKDKPSDGLSRTNPRKVMPNRQFCFSGEIRSGPSGGLGTRRPDRPAASWTAGARSSRPSSRKAIPTRRDPRRRN